MTADDRAWDVFLEALDAESRMADHIPTGAAIVASDTPDRGELVRRYHGGTGQWCWSTLRAA